MNEPDFDCQCRLPRDNELVRVNPDPEQRGVKTLAYDKGDDKWYLIGASISDHLKKTRPNIVKDYMLFVTQNIDKEIFLWPVEMPVLEDHPAFVAMKNWIAYEFDSNTARLEPSSRH